MKTVKIHYGDKSKNFRITILTELNTFQKHLFRVFEIKEDNHLIYGFQGDEKVIDMKNFLEECKNTFDYNLLIQGGGSSEIISSEGKIDFIRKPSPTFGAIRIDSKEESFKAQGKHSRNNSNSRGNISHSYSLEDNLPVHSLKNIEHMKKLEEDRRNQGKINIFSLMKKIEDIDEFLNSTLKENKGWLVIFIFGPLNPSPIFVDERTIEKYRKISFYFYNVKLINEHSERFFLNPPMVASYIDNKKIPELAYTSSESQIQDIINNFSQFSKQAPKSRHKNFTLPIDVSDVEEEKVSRKNSPTSQQKMLMMDKTRKTISFGVIGDAYQEKKFVHQSQRCSIALKGVAYKEQLLTVLRGMKNKYFKDKKEDYVYFTLYIQMMKDGKPINIKKELNEERLMRFLRKKQISGIIKKKMKKNYRDFDLQDIVRVMKEVGLLSKTEGFEINASLEDDGDLKKKMYEKILKRFLVGKMTMGEAIQKLIQKWKKERMKHFENRIFELQRPKSANPGTLTLEAFLKTRARKYFTEEEISILEDLANKKDEVLITSFEMYEKRSKENELVETFKIIINKTIEKEKKYQEKIYASSEKKKISFRNKTNSSKNSMISNDNHSFEYFLETEEDLRSRASGSRRTPKKLQSEIIAVQKNRQIFMKKEDAEEVDSQLPLAVDHKNNQDFFQNDENFATPNFLKPNKIASSKRDSLMNSELESRAEHEDSIPEAERDFYSKLLQFCISQPQVNIQYKLSPLIQDLMLKKIDLKEFEKSIIEETKNTLNLLFSDHLDHTKIKEIYQFPEKAKTIFFKEGQEKPNLLEEATSELKKFLNTLAGKNILHPNSGKELHSNIVIKASPTQTLRSLRDRLPSSRSVSSNSMSIPKVNKPSRYSKDKLMNRMIGKARKAKNIIKARKMRGLDESPEKAVSVVSMCKTNLSRRTTGRELEKAKEELLHDMYGSHFRSKKSLQITLEELIVNCKKEGVEITNMQKQNMEDQLQNNHPALLVLLHCFRHKKDVNKIRDRINRIKNFNPDQITHITTAKETRRDHVVVFSTLLDYLRTELFLIHQAHHDLFMHLLVTEDLLLLSAYEVFMFDGDIDEFVDSLFLIYRTRKTEMSTDNRPSESLEHDVKEKQRQLLFSFKKKIQAIIYKKLMDLINLGDTTTLDFYNRIVKNGENKDRFSKFVDEITKFAQEKIKRQIKLNKLKKNKVNQEQEWKDEFIGIARSFVKKLKLTKIDLLQAVSEFQEASKAIYQVFLKTDDMGDFRENIKILMDCYFKTLYGYDTEDSLSRVLVEGGIEGTKVYRFLQILEDEKDKHHKAAKTVEGTMIAMADEKEEIVSMMKIFVKKL